MLKKNEKTLQIAIKLPKSPYFFNFLKKKSFLNRTLGLRKSFLNQTTCVLKNRLYQQSSLNQDSFLNQAFLNRDSTVLQTLLEQCFREFSRIHSFLELKKYLVKTQVVRESGKSLSQIMLE